MKRFKARMTPKQRLFIAEYLVDFNGAAAAIRAGYSPKQAGQKAWQLRKWRPDIAKAIDDAIAARERRTFVTADRVLQEYARIAFADIRRLVEHRPEGMVLKNPAALSADDAAVISEISLVGGRMTVKLHDKRHALAAIERLLGLPARLTGRESGAAESGLPAREILRRRLARLAGEEPGE